jgi:hypothetical protein
MKLFLIFLTLSIQTAYASCWPPALIPDDAQIDLKKKIRLTLVDKNFLGANGLDVYWMTLPQSYKEVEFDRAHLSVWNGDKLVSHTSLGTTSYLEKSSNIIEFTHNRLSSTNPNITIVYGNMCGDMHQLNIDNLEDFEIEHNKESENYYEINTAYFRNGRNQH